MDLAQPRQCDCRETYYTDTLGKERRIWHPYHDCEYVAERSRRAWHEYQASLRKHG